MSALWRWSLCAVLSLDSAIPETLAMKGLSYIVEGSQTRKALESLEAALNLVPAQADIRARSRPRTRREVIPRARFGSCAPWSVGATRKSWKKPWLP